MTIIASYWRGEAISKYIIEREKENQIKDILAET